MHQLHAEAVAAEVAYTMSITQPSCSRGGGSDRVPNNFKEVMGLPQAVCWKLASDTKVVRLEKLDEFKGAVYKV